MLLLLLCCYEALSDPDACAVTTQMQSEHRCIQYSICILHYILVAVCRLRPSKCQRTEVHGDELICFQPPSVQFHSRNSTAQANLTRCICIQIGAIRSAMEPLSFSKCIPHRWCTKRDLILSINYVDRENSAVYRLCRTPECKARYRFTSQE